MKINNLTGNISIFPNQVRDKKDLSEQESQKQQQERKKKDSEETPDPKSEKFAEEIEKAVSSFHGGPDSSGLTASTQGRGPGLKVVLSDPSGNVLREFTGEEFLKLKNSSKTDGKGRGKILDQKL